MSIYSANRTGSMSIANVVANENYAPVDLGRIMYESQRNDMMIFEAILASDFNEMAGLREGTLLRSEIAALNEASIKDIMAGFGKRLKEFWAKIKHAFDVIIQKISAYILRDGKAFAKEFREAYAKAGKEFSGDIKYFARNDFEIKIPNVYEIESEINASKNDENKLKTSEVVASVLSKYIGENVKNAREYSSKIPKKCFIEKKVSSSDIEGMLKSIENASDAVKNLRTAQKNISDQISKAGKRLKDAEREMLKGSNTKGNSIHNISTMVSALEIVVSTTSRIAIKVVKDEVRNNRTALSKVLSSVKHENAILAESAAVVAGDEVDNALTDVPGEDNSVDPDTQEAIDAVVDNADAEIAKECGKNC